MGRLELLSDRQEVLDALGGTRTTFTSSRFGSADAISYLAQHPNLLLQINNKLQASTDFLKRTADRHYDKIIAAINEDARGGERPSPSSTSGGLAATATGPTNLRALNIRDRIKAGSAPEPTAAALPSQHSGFSIYGGDASGSLDSARSTSGAARFGSLSLAAAASSPQRSSASTAVQMSPVGNVTASVRTPPALADALSRIGAAVDNRKPAATVTAAPAITAQRGVKAAATPALPPSASASSAAAASLSPSSDDFLSQLLARSQMMLAAVQDDDGDADGAVLTAMANAPLGQRQPMQHSVQQAIDAAAASPPPPPPPPRREQASTAASVPGDQRNDNERHVQLQHPPASQVQRISAQPQVSMASQQAPQQQAVEGLDDYGFGGHEGGVGFDAPQRSDTDGDQRHHHQQQQQQHRDDRPDPDVDHDSEAAALRAFLMGGLDYDQEGMLKQHYSDAQQQQEDERVSQAIVTLPDQQQLVPTHGPRSVAGSGSIISGGYGPGGQRLPKNSLGMPPPLVSSASIMHLPRNTQSTRSLIARRGTGITAVLARIPKMQAWSIRETMIDILHLRHKKDTMATRIDSDALRQPDDPLPEVMESILQEIAEREELLFVAAGPELAQLIMDSIINDEQETRVAMGLPEVMEVEEDLDGYTNSIGGSAAGVWRRRLDTRNVQPVRREAPVVPLGGVVNVAIDGINPDGTRAIFNPKNGANDQTAARRQGNDNVSYYQRQQARYGRGRRGSTGIADAWRSVFADAGPAADAGIASNQQQHQLLDGGAGNPVQGEQAEFGDESQQDDAQYYDENGGQNQRQAEADNYYAQQQQHDSRNQFLQQASLLQQQKSQQIQHTRQQRRPSVESRRPAADASVGKQRSAVHDTQQQAQGRAAGRDKYAYGAQSMSQRRASGTAPSGAATGRTAAAAASQPPRQPGRPPVLSKAASQVAKQQPAPKAVSAWGEVFASAGSSASQPMAQQQQRQSSPSNAELPGARSQIGHSVRDGSAPLKHSHTSSAGALSHSIMTTSTYGSNDSEQERNSGHGSLNSTGGLYPLPAALASDRGGTYNRVNVTDAEVPTLSAASPAAQQYQYTYSAANREQKQSRDLLNPYQPSLVAPQIFHPAPASLPASGPAGGSAAEYYHGSPPTHGQTASAAAASAPAPYAQQPPSYRRSAPASSSAAASGGSTSSGFDLDRMIADATSLMAVLQT